MLLRVMEAVHEGREFPMLMSLHLSILSRLILASHSLFAALCLTSATRIGSNHNDVAGKVEMNLTRSQWDKIIYIFFLSGS